MIDKIDEILEKNAIVRNLILDMKMPKISYFDRARLIKRALDIAGEGKKRDDGQGKIASKVAKEIGLSGHKELYRCMAILNINDKTLKRIEDGEITPEKVARVMYNLKDKTKEDEIIEEVIKGKMPTLKAEKMVAEINNPKVILNHLLRQSEVFLKELDSFDGKCDNLDAKQKILGSTELNRVLDKVQKFKEKNFI